MGKAGVGLPDPLDQAASPTGAAGTDDLLAQLAGEEIDRLFAESDRGTAAVPAPDGPPAPPTAPDATTADSDPQSPAPKAAAPSDPLKLLDEVQRRADAIEAGVKNLTAASPPPAKGPTPAEQAMLDELHQLFQEVTPAAAPAGDKTAAETPAPGEAWQPRSKVDSAADDATTDATIDAELNALFVEATARDGGSKPVEEGAAAKTPTPGGAEAKQGVAADPLADLEAELAAAVTTSAADEPARAEATDGLPVYLKPLEWLNAPFAGLSEGLREALGKIAIVTLVNAFAVLLYVMIFRGR